MTPTNPIPQPPLPPPPKRRRYRKAPPGTIDVDGRVAIFRDEIFFELPQDNACLWPNKPGVVVRASSRWAVHQVSRPHAHWPEIVSYWPIGRMAGPEQFPRVAGWTAAAEILRDLGFDPERPFTLSRSERTTTITQRRHP